MRLGLNHQKVRLTAASGYPRPRFLFFLLSWRLSGRRAIASGQGDSEQTQMPNDRIPMSKEGYEKKKAQLDNMKNDEMPRIAEMIAVARAFGDLSENAEFDAAVEAQ